MEEGGGPVLSCDMLAEGWIEDKFVCAKISGEIVTVVANRDKATMKVIRAIIDLDDSLFIRIQYQIFILYIDCVPILTILTIVDIKDLYRYYFNTNHHFLLRHLYAATGFDKSSR
jgi:hypothetical protein